MRFVNVRELHNGTPRVLRMVRRGEKIVVTQRGKPQAAILPLSEGDIEDLVLAHPLMEATYRTSRQEAKSKGWLTLEDVRRRLGL